MKRFITEGKKEASLEKIRSAKMNLSMSGEDVQKMYQEILEMPETAKETPSNSKELPKTLRKTLKSTPTAADLFKNLHDTEKVHEILDSCPDLISATDQFKWTSLMMAACDGLDETCFILLQRGAKLGYSDGKGNTAFSLAVKNRRQNVIDLLDSIGIEVTSSSSEDEEPFWCEICKETIEESNQRRHEASTLHQFNSKSILGQDKPVFGIPHDNIGYQMMLRQGWNASTGGLGPEQKGRRFPVKTVLRKTRQGLGLKQNPARVSHFSAYDREAVKYKPQPKVKTRHDMQRERIKNRQLDLKLRRELS